MAWIIAIVVLSIIAACTITFSVTITASRASRAEDDTPFNMLSEVTYTDENGKSTTHSALTMSRGCGDPNCSLCAWRDTK